MTRKKIERARKKGKKDEFMKWFIPARENAMRYKLPHEYTGKLYSIILNYDKWHKEKYGKTTKEYLMQDYLQHLKDSQKENEILELMKLNNYKDEELLEYARAEKIKRLKGEYKFYGKTN